MSYDLNLLAEAQLLQEGYNVNLPNQSPRCTPVRGPPPPETIRPQPVSVPSAPATANAGSGEKLGSAASAPAATTSHTSFWRSRNGIIAIVVAVLIVIGAVVGGAVGGTIKSSNVNSGTTESATSSPPITAVTDTPVATTASQAIIGGETTTASLTKPTSLATSTSLGVASESLISLTFPLPLPSSLFVASTN